MSDRGERGPTGDHGQAGETGERGPRGRGYPKNVVVAFAVVVLLATAVVAGMGYYVSQARDNARKNRTALLALCAQRHDLDVRIARTQKFLDETPGRMIFGIPRQLIVDGHRQSIVTRQNLEILDCKEAP